MEQQAIDRGQGRVNQLGGAFINGRPLPAAVRSKIVQLSATGMRNSEISAQLRVSHGCVTKILKLYQETGDLQPKPTGGSKPRVCTPQVKSQIVSYLEKDPGLFAGSIRESLLLDGTCIEENLPSLSSVTRLLAGLRGQKGDSEQVHDAAEDASKDLLRHRKQRSSFTTHQMELLEQEYQIDHYPGLDTKERLAALTGLSRQTVQIWFSNRRAKTRKMKIAATATKNLSSCMWTNNNHTPTTADDSNNTANPAYEPISPPACPQYTDWKSSCSVLPSSSMPSSDSYKSPCSSLPKPTPCYNNAALTWDSPATCVTRTPSMSSCDEGYYSSSPGYSPEIHPAQYRRQFNHPYYSYVPQSNTTPADVKSTIGYDYYNRYSYPCSPYTPPQIKQEMNESFGVHSYMGSSPAVYPYQPYTAAMQADPSSQHVHSSGRMNSVCGYELPPLSIKTDS